MSIEKVPLHIVQLSDIHVGGPRSFKADQMASIRERVNRIAPDVIVVAGDMTTDGYEAEFQEAKAFLDTLEAPQVYISGNHDARNVGYLHFQRYFGSSFNRYRCAFDGNRAERLGATGYTIVGVDSSEPDVNEGRIGRERYHWIKEQFDEPDDIKIFAVHHHLVSIPGTGRERNIVIDAGDVLLALTQLDIDMIVSGHKHVPNFWGLNGMLICNSGTAATRRVRGVTPPSWNEILVDASTIKVYVHYEDGRRELSALFNRKTRALTRESFYITDDFMRSNGVAVLGEGRE
jgi:3',5'-cyclic AMP phosphodiesterase CpdA